MFCPVYQDFIQTQNHLLTLPLGGQGYRGLIHRLQKLNLCQTCLDKALCIHVCMEMNLCISAECGTVAHKIVKPDTACDIAFGASIVLEL